MTAATSRKSKSAPHGWPYQAAAVVAGVVAMAAASRVAFPLGPVPITLQTYALFVLAGVFGGRIGLFVVAGWLAAAAVGLPVLAGGAHGWAAMSGKTAGFLAGMALAAWIVGHAAERARGWMGMIGLMLAGHAIVLALGWAWLAFVMDGASSWRAIGDPATGPAWRTAHTSLLPASAVDAWRSAILPLLPGAVLKSLAAAATVKLVRR